MLSEDFKIAFENQCADAIYGAPRTQVGLEINVCVF